VILILSVFFVAAFLRSGLRIRATT